MHIFRPPPPYHVNDYIVGKVHAKKAEPEPWLWHYFSFHSHSPVNMHGQVSFYFSISFIRHCRWICSTRTIWSQVFITRGLVNLNHTGMHNARYIESMRTLITEVIWLFSEVNFKVKLYIIVLHSELFGIGWWWQNCDKLKSRKLDWCLVLVQQYMVCINWIVSLLTVYPWKKIRWVGKGFFITTDFHVTSTWNYFQSRNTICILLSSKLIKNWKVTKVGKQIVHFVKDNHSKRSKI